MSIEWSDFKSWVPLILASAVAVWVVVDLVPTKVRSQEICERSTIQFVGLETCFRDQGCMLSDQELNDRYVSKKNMMMSCERAKFELMLSEVLKDLEEDEEGDDEGK